MRCLVVFLGLISPVVAQQTFTIVEGRGADGWCDGMDSAPDASLGTATSAQDCFDKCKQTYPATIAIDFWDINNPTRNEGNICWCQDACDCLKPSLPAGGNGTLYMEAGATRGPSCGYDLRTITEAVTSQGWCVGSDIGLNTSMMSAVNNQHQCWSTCRMLYPSTVAIDWWADRNPPQCFCQSECPCMQASAAGGGNGMLAIAETTPITGDYCYRMTAGVGEEGWCVGMDMAPNASLPIPTTAKQCFDNCKATYANTVAVDFWTVSHPERNSGNICWCQDQCSCTMASKADAGNGRLFVESGTMKGNSCGVDMTKVVEGNAGSLCSGSPTPASAAVGGMYGCQSQCATDGFSIAVFYNTDNACHCYSSCPCRTSVTTGMGPGYSFHPETMADPMNCDSSMSCGDVRTAYRSGNCCGQPSSTLQFFG